MAGCGTPLAGVATATSWVSDRTSPALLACRRTMPSAGNVAVALPAASVVTLTPGPATVAPATGVALPVTSYLTTDSSAACPVWTTAGA